MLTGIPIMQAVGFLQLAVLCRRTHQGGKASQPGQLYRLLWMNTSQSKQKKWRQPGQRSTTPASAAAAGTAAVPRLRPRPRCC